LRTLTGHQSQIYAIAFDGVNIATGSLDTSVRIWDAKSGYHPYLTFGVLRALIGSTEKAVLMGHTSLVGQIQMRGNTLVTGGSDGSIRVWDLAQLKCVLRMAAHDNSVTSLQFDDKIIVTGGSDGYVKVTPQSISPLFLYAVSSHPFVLHSILMGRFGIYVRERISVT
jgi:F-box and WD-40 domain protein CDC4